jgi:hypothetical protein
MVFNKNSPQFNEATGFFASWVRECVRPAPSKHKAWRSSGLYEHYVRYCNKLNGESFVMSPELWGQWMIENEGMSTFNFQGTRKRMAVIEEPVHE